MHLSRALYLTLAALLLLATAGLRFHDLAQRSMWHDEALTANLARGSLAETLRQTQELHSAPMVHPTLLWLTQKVASTPASVRLPSAVASLLAVALTLCLPRVGVERWTALLAALLLAVSAFQIRYAQEAREYALSVLVGVAMLYACCQLGLDRKRWRLLAVTVLLGPFVQYGLVLLAFAVLLSIGVEQLRRHGLRQAVSTLAVPGALYALSCAASAWLTVRHQWQLTSVEYLDANYFDPASGGAGAVLIFLARNVHAFLACVLPGHLVAPGVVIMALAACGGVIRGHGEPHGRRLAAVAVVAGLCVGAASVAHIYPLGGIRQDIFLTPVVALAVAASLTYVGRWLPRPAQPAWIAACLGGILIGGALDLYRHDPYREVEDIKTVIARLEASRRPGDAIYVYYGARPALDFYGVGGAQFRYGSMWRADREQYLRELQELVGPDVERLWLVFSHAYEGEDGHILSQLVPRWSIVRSFEARGASLHLGVRLSPGARPGDR
jgi:hypothetical protein